MTKDEVLKMALEALELCNGAETVEGVVIYTDKEIAAIKEALAQPAQTNTRPYYTIDELNAWGDEKEKQAWRNAAIRIGEELSSVGPDGYYDMDAWKWLEWAMEQEPRGKNSLAQPEQKPVAWVDLLKEAQQIVESKVLYKKFIDGTPLSNDIACWMAAFAQQHTPPPAQPEQVAIFGMNQDDWKDVVAAISKVRDGRGIYLACRPADVFQEWFLALGTAKLKEKNT